MGKKSSHWIRSMISVFVLGIIIFLVIYLFYPEVSLKFFKIGFKAEERVSKAFENMLVENLDMDEDDASAYVNSPDGEKAVKEAMDALKKGARSIGDAMSKESLKKSINSIKDGDSK